MRRRSNGDGSESGSWCLKLTKITHNFLKSFRKCRLNALQNYQKIKQQLQRWSDNNSNAQKVGRIYIFLYIFKKARSYVDII